MSLIQFHKPEKVMMQKASDDHGTFLFSPLERGYGVTIGNAMRRTLLSSLEGYAITTLKIEGVDHEFSTIDGVYEDIIDIVLNLKQVRFKKIDGGDDNETIAISLSGKEKFVAKEITKASSNFQVLNEDHIICNMEPSVKLNLEIEVNKGRGYVPAEENKPDEAPIGIIPVDSVFTPIKRVNYKVENTRVGQNVDFDKLTLDVLTDGSIHPKDAIKEASRILIQHFSLFSDQSFALTDSAHDDDEMDDEFLRMRKLLKTDLQDLQVSVRSYNCLKAAGIRTLGDLVKYDVDKLLKFRNFGKKSLKELQAIVDEKGLQFGMDISRYKIEDE